MKHSSKFALIAIFASLFAFTSESYASDRSTYTAWGGANRGTTVRIPVSRVAELCGDWDGCTVRIAMWNWDGKRRDASRETLFYYDTWTGNWRSEKGDVQGTANNSVTQHVINAWSCYFTDGNYRNWTNFGDYNRDFAVLSWNQYNATCKVTLID